MSFTLETTPLKDPSYGIDRYVRMDGYGQHWMKLDSKLVPPTRIERVTLPLGGGCSIH